MESSFSYDIREVSLGAELPADDRNDMWLNHLGGVHGTGKALFSSPKKFWGRMWTQQALAKKDNDPDRLQLVECTCSAVRYDRSDKVAGLDGDDSARLVIPLAGRAELLQSGHAAAVCPGQMGILRWDQAMVISHGDGFRGYSINIPAYALPTTREPRGPLGMRPQNAILKTVRLLANNLAEDRQELTGMEFIAISRSLIDLIAGTLDDRRAPQLDMYARLVADARRRIRLYSDDAHLSVQTLADSLGCSRRQLEIAMKTVSGKSPGAELRDTRLQRAYERLADPNDTRAIVDIAMSSGYSSLSGFRASFAAKFGLQPGELKLQARSPVQPPPRPKIRNRPPDSR
ncbi:helix-turn-helix domain-containing protein [Nocardia brasiliensis]